jgi:GGDEF domain-containing protein
MSTPTRAVEGGAGGPLRVVLVGRTGAHGVDAALRTDREIELVRARTAIAALGELSDPIDGTSPPAVTVVVAAGAVPAARSRAFAGAVRRISAEAKVVAVGGDVPEGFDGRLSAGAGAAELRGQVRGAFEPSPAGPEADAMGPGVTAAGGAGGAGEPDPAVALATGRDAVAAALAGIRRRLDAEVRFVPAGGEGAGVPVEFGGRALGRMAVSPRAGAAPPAADALGREAGHLAVWLTLSAQQEGLRQAAFTDELTGAYNRRYFNRFLAAAIEQAGASRHTVTLLVFDVDNFKTYNDRFGHAAGDEILVEAVRLLNACIRTSDRVCRIGGDEFAVVFHDPEGPRGGGGGGAAGGAGAATSPQNIGEIVRRFQRQVCEHRFPKLAQGAPGVLTVSGGMATFPWDGRTVEGLLARADELALRSKAQGKNHITLGPGAERACGAE